MDKKAAGLSLEYTIIAVLLLAVLIVGLLMIIRGGGLGRDIASFAPSSAVTCAAQLGVKTPDIDNDGLKDTCDNCVCPGEGCQNPVYDFKDPLRPKISNPRDDNDQDGLPSKCDANDDNANIIEWSDKCKNNIKEAGAGKAQCILS